MAIIQIPLKDPEPSERPPARPTPPVSEQLSFEGAFYDARGWEDAYRDLHATPALLIQTQDDLARSRMREAFWISVIFHLVAVVFLLLSPKFDKWFPHKPVLLVQNQHQQAIPLFLDLPPDAQKVPKPPNTNNYSDKDRIASTRRPHVDAQELRRILDASRPGAPGRPAQPTPPTQPTPPPVSAAQNPTPPQQSQPAGGQPAPPASNQTAKLQTHPLSPKNVFGGPMSAGSTIEEATRAAAANRGGYGGSGGDYGLDRGRQPAKANEQFEILTDTKGFDFGPYLARILKDIRDNWINAIPVSASMRRGKVAIDFAILKNGTISGMETHASSGDVPLDRAAWAGIKASDPFQPLPSGFTGDYLGIRIYFLYNLEETDLQP